MTPWKLVLMMLVFLLPGGSLVLAVLAAAKAWGVGKERLKRSTTLSPAPAMAVAEGGQV